MESRENNNKFLDLVSSPLMNLDHTYRYSGTKLVESETLSQHITDTIMMGLKIVDQVNAIAGKIIIHPAEYVMKAVYHDLEEVITGDIPRPLKYYNEATKNSLKKVADDVAVKFFSSQFSEPFGHYKVWRDAKKGVAGYILKLVDTLVVANKVIKEVSLLHNFYMLRVAHEVSQYLTELYDNLNHDNDSELSEINDVKIYLLDILDGAILSMDQIMTENKSCMDSLNIYGQSMI